MRNVALFAILDVLTVNDKNLLEDIKNELEFKLYDIEDREPQSTNGDAYDRWQEKVDELQYILDDLESICEADYEIEQTDIDNIVNSIENYQEEYRGLKSIKITIY